VLPFGYVQVFVEESHLKPAHAVSLLFSSCGDMYPSLRVTIENYLHLPHELRPFGFERALIGFK
jgi:hypothetical protein